MKDELEKALWVEYEECMTKSKATDLDAETRAMLYRRRMEILKELNAKYKVDLDAEVKRAEQQEEERHNTSMEILEDRNLEYKKEIELARNDTQLKLEAEKGKLGANRSALEWTKVAVSVFAIGVAVVEMIWTLDFEKNGRFTSTASKFVPRPKVLK